MPDILPELTEIFREAFGDDQLVLRPQMTAADIKGWDSFKHVEILIAAQERFGVRFRSREIDEMASVGDLVAAIKRHER